MEDETWSSVELNASEYCLSEGAKRKRIQVVVAYIDNQGNKILEQT